MYEHLRIVGPKGELALPEDFSLNFEDVNPLFNDNVESGSYPVKVPLDGNRIHFQDVENVKSDLKITDLETKGWQIIADGIPYRFGEMVASEDQELTDSLDFTINSYIRSLDEMISDMECWDVPIKDDVQIGECIGNVTPVYTFKVETEITYNATILEDLGGGQYKLIDGHKTKVWDDYTLEESGDEESYSGGEISMPVIGFSVPHAYKEADSKHIITAKDESSRPVIEKNFINTSRAYGESDANGNPAYYCNARVCYTNYKVGNDGTTSDEVDKSGNPFYTLEAERPGSGICFYVLYFLDCLFDCLNISYSNENLLKVEDMKRLAFYTTHCEYDTERKYPNGNTFDLASIAQINSWLSNRQDGLNIKTAKFDTPYNSNEWKDIESLRVYPKRAGEKLYFGWGELDGGLLITPYAPNYVKKSGTAKVGSYIPVYEQIPIRQGSGQGQFPSAYGINPKEVTAIRAKCVSAVGDVKANIMKMYANSKNFPETSVSSIIDSLWASFGIKFVLDYEKQTATPYYIREVLRNTEPPRKIHGTILSINKVAEKTTGFRMRYAAESAPKDQSKNVRDGVRDYETAYDYLMSASPIDASLSYAEIKAKKSISDTTCYVDKSTGDAFRWKIDKNAATVYEAGRSLALFEVAGLKGVEIGDCSKRNEDYIVDITSDFEPVVFTDVNARDAKSESILAAFADEDMLNAEEHFELTFAIGTTMVDFPLTATILTNESYDPSNTEDGNSPLQSYDWGKSIAVMRGGGSDARIQYYDYNYDGFNNSKYRVVSGKYAMTSDSTDHWGVDYDYNADGAGVGTGERFSLKIRAYKEDPNTGEILCNDDEKDAAGNITKKIRSRGLFDTFMSEYAHFLLNRKKFVIRMLCEVAELADIPNHWESRYQIGDFVGWINKVKSHMTAKAGLEEVEIEMFCL